MLGVAVIYLTGRSIPLYAYTVIHASILLLMDVLVASTLGLLKVTRHRPLGQGTSTPDSCHLACVSSGTWFNGQGNDQWSGRERREGGERRVCVILELDRQPLSNRLCPEEKITFRRGV